MEIKEFIQKIGEDAGNSVSKFAKGVAENSKKLAEKTKTKKTMQGFERKIQESYQQIGKIYFSLHGEMPEEEYSEYVKNIILAQEEVAKCQQKLAELEKSSICSSCGSVIENTQRFCPQCGAKNEEAFKENKFSGEKEPLDESIIEAESEIVEHEVKDDNLSVEESVSEVIVSDNDSVEDIDSENN